MPPSQNKANTGMFAYILILEGKGFSWFKIYLVYWVTLAIKFFPHYCIIPDILEARQWALKLGPELHIDDIINYVGWELFLFYIYIYIYRVSQEECANVEITA